MCPLFGGSIQWNISIVETAQRVLIKEVSSFQRYTVGLYMKIVLIKEGALIREVPLFQSAFIKEVTFATYCWPTVKRSQHHMYTVEPL